MIAAGDETGLLKLVNSDTRVVKAYGTQNRSQAVVSLLDVEGEIDVVRADGSVERWTLDESDAELLQKHVVHTSLSDVACCGRTAAVTVVCGSQGNCATIGSENNVHFFSVPGPLAACAAHPELSDSILFGGKERDLFLYDLSTETTKWEAKNVPHDNLNLRVPVWITAVDAFDANTFLTGTAHKHIRLYDVRESRRPIKSIDMEGDFRVSALRVTGDNFVVADTGGNQILMDARNFSRIRCFKGATGSIRALHVADSTVYSGGLDRHLRVYHRNSSTAACTIYLRNRINALLPLSATSLNAVSNENDEAYEESVGEDKIIDFIDSDDE